MSDIQNTTEQMRDPAWQLLMLADAMGHDGSPSNFIEEQERNGQAQLVNSDRLPTKIQGTYEGRELADAFRAVGFTFGEPDASDPPFRPATLPAGWSRKATDHPMWSKIVDQYGRERVEVFYKAAFYDRKAFMRMVTTRGHLWSLLHNDEEPIVDGEWLTAEVARTELAELAAGFDNDAAKAADRAARGDEDGYWAGAAAEYRARAAKARAMCEAVS